MIRRLDEMQLFGVDLASNSKRYKLSTAYISLLIEREYSKNTDIEDTREIVKVEEALKQNPKLFIQGGAGAGKTTLLQWIAVMSSARNLKNELTEWNDNVPFFIRLRSFANKDLPSPNDFASLISETLEAAPDNWVRHKLESGKAIVLVDGLDELPVDRKDDVRKWLRDLTDIDGFPNAIFILTSRPHSVDEGWLDSEGFLEANLQDMNSTDIESFITHWHDAAREDINDPEKIKNINELEEALKQLIQENGAIFKLASSPLLCAVICSLHRDRMQSIPEDRIELYEACIEMFLRRDHERRILLPQYPNLNSRQIKVLLSDLAYWYLRNGISVADINEVDDRLQNKLEHFKNLPKDTNGTSVRKGLVARSGILREPVSGKIDFPHRTFQEFLAAKQIIDDRDFGLLAGKANDLQNWSETIILTAGLAPKSDAEELIKQLLVQFDKNNNIGILLVAVGCLEAVVSTPSTSEYEIKKRLSKVLPPKSMSQAESLALAGDMVVPFLSLQNTRTIPQASVCIRALAIIGTDSAFEILKYYAEKKTRPGVWRSLIQSRDFALSRTRYDEEILKRVSLYRFQGEPYPIAEIDGIGKFPLSRKSWYRLCNIERLNMFFDEKEIVLDHLVSCIDGDGGAYGWDSITEDHEYLPRFQKNIEGWWIEC